MPRWCWAGGAAVFAGIAGAPTWLVLTAVFVAAAAVPVGNIAKAWREQRSRDQTDQRGLAAGPAGLVRDRSTKDVRVHRAVREDVPYIERDVEARVVDLLRRERRALITGPSMSGKTRLALSAAQKALGDYVFYEPANGESLRGHWARGSKIDRVLVWLDDLERFAAAGGLSDADLSTVVGAGEVAVLATIRTTEYEKFQPTGEVKPPGWEAAAWFGEPVWLTGWSDPELARLADARASSAVLNDARKYGLSNYLGGAPLVDRRLAIGEAEDSSGYGVVRAAADWRRAGMQHPIALDTLAAVLPGYVDRRHSVSVEDQMRNGLAWATEPINQTVALLVEEAAGFRALDLALDRFVQLGTPIPDPLWDAAVEAASRAESADVGASSYYSGRLDVAERAWRKAAVADPAPEGSSDRRMGAEAGVNLGVVLGKLGRHADAVAANDQLIEEYRDDPALRDQVGTALVNKGARLAALGRPADAVAAYDQVIHLYRDDPALCRQVANALVNKGVALAALGRPGDDLAAYNQVIDRYRDDPAPALREQVGTALYNKGVTLAALGRPDDELAAYSQLIDEYGNDPAPALRRKVASALVNKGATAGDLGWSEDAVAAYHQVIHLYRDDPALREQVASALISKGMALGALDWLEDAVAAFDQVIHLYRDDPALRERVATALVNKGVALGELGRPAEAVAAYNQVIDRYSDDPALREVVEWADQGKARHQR